MYNIYIYIFLICLFLYVVVSFIKNLFFNLHIYAVRDKESKD